MERTVFGRVLSFKGDEARVGIVCEGNDASGELLSLAVSKTALSAAGISVATPRPGHEEWFVASQSDDGTLFGFAPMPRTEELELSSIKAQELQDV